MTILIPTIPRPRGGRQQRGKLFSEPRHQGEASEDFSEITLAMDGETEHEHEDTHDEEQEAADAETRPPPSREERNKRVIPWPSLAPPDLSKALSAAVIGFDGSREDFDNFNVHLAFYLDSVGFILQQARQVYDTLSYSDKDRLVKARRTFIDTYGLVGLTTAHHDCLRIFEFIFTKFPHTKGLVRMDRIMAANNSTDKQGASLIWNDIVTYFTPTETFACKTTMRTIDMSSKFDGHNWYDLTQELDAEIDKTAGQFIRLRDLAALRMLESIRQVGKYHADWAALHRLLLDLPLSEWSQVRGTPDKYLTILNKGTALQKRIDEGDTSCGPMPPLSEMTTPARAYSAALQESVRLPGDKHPAHGCQCCPMHCMFPDGKWRKYVHPAQLSDAQRAFKNNPAQLAFTRDRKPAKETYLAFPVKLRHWIDSGCMGKCPDSEEYSRFTDAPGGAPYSWDDGEVGVPDYKCAGRLEAYYQSITGEHPKARHVFTASVPTQQARDAAYHSYLAGAASNYVPDDDNREWGYYDKYNRFHPTSPTSDQRYSAGH
jgi:hypothetical protein